MAAIPGPDKLYKIFYAVTGVGLIGVIMGFTSCLFDLEQISECVDHAEYAVDVLAKFGNHVVQWFLAILGEVTNRNY